MRLCVLVFAVCLGLVGCAGTQVVPDRLRADHQVGGVFGQWEHTPNVLLHPSLSNEEVDAVRRELLALNEVSGCNYLAVPMIPSLAQQLEVYGGLPNQIVVKSAPPLLPAKATAEMHLNKEGTQLYYVEVRLGENASSRTVRHELVHALTGVLDNHNGHESLLMSLKHHPGHDSSLPGDEAVTPTHGTGLKLLEAEKALFRCN